ncbi:hypothetical protein [Nocardia sp. NPDC049149]|uniref:hypothetical protein n=1 Tax=Nocardia sp. NPDC049149 TaxID=3364315 RepID=UPI003721BF72
MSHLVCQYCSHRNTGAESRCTHCGGPLKAAEKLLAAASGPVVSGTAEAAVAGAANVVKGVEKTVAKHIPWRIGIIGVVVLAVLGFFGIRACSLPTLSLATADPSRSLPVALRTAAQCERPDGATRTTKCVIGANDPLLLGGIAGGRPMAFTMAVLPPDRLIETLGQWRTAGGVTVADGPVFAAIGPTSTVWFADQRTGFRLETEAFSGRAAAQTFLARTGLGVTGRP